MDLVKPVLLSVAAIVVGLVGAVFVGSFVSRYRLSDLVDYFAVISPVVLAVFVGSGVAARVHAAPHRHRPVRHLLAALLGPLLFGILGAVGVESGVDHEVTARVANLVLPVGAALAGLGVLDRRDDRGTVVPALAEPWR